MKYAPLAAAALLLAACGDAEEAAPAQPMTVANPYHDALLRANELTRYATIRAAVARNRQPCDRVLRAAHGGPFTNLQYWTVRCASPSGGGYRYGLFLAPDGQTQVRSCQSMPALKLPACRADV